MNSCGMTKTAPQLLEHAKTQTGISHIVDQGIVEALEKLLWSLNNEAQLTERGSRAAEQRILRILCNRVRMLRDFEAHPEIEEQQIVTPLFITGAVRTGSTKLHKLLAATGDFHFLPFWQSLNPALLSGDRNEDPAERIADTEAFCQWFETAAPGSKWTHELSAKEPEEESFVFEQNRFGLNMLAYFNVPAFLQFDATRPFHDNLAYLQKTLKYLQWQFYQHEIKPWVLKYPFYAGMEPLIREYFPDARFVHTHRHPEKFIASAASTVREYRKAYSDVDSTAGMGPMLLEQIGNQLGQTLRVRREHPEIRCIDIAYSDVVASGVDVIRRIYSLMPLAFGDDTASTTARWESDNRQGKHGKHRYSPDEFSVSRAAIEEKCADYLAYFERLL